MDARALQAVVGANREIKILDLLVELSVVTGLLGSEDRNLFLLLGGLGQIHEGSHMLVDDISSLHDGVTRRKRTVGLDLEDEAIVVGVLTHAASLNELGAAVDRRVQRVDMNDADRIAVTLVRLIRDITATIADAHAHREVTALVEGSDVLLGVDELELRRNEEVCTGDLARTVDRNGGGSLVGGTERTEHQTLNVQDDISDVLNHVGDSHELVLRTIDLDGLDSCALERGEKDTTQGITQRVTIATLERLNRDARRRFVDFLDLNLGPNEF